MTSIQFQFSCTQNFILKRTLKSVTVKKYNNINKTNIYLTTQIFEHKYTKKLKSKFWLGIDILM